MAADLKGAFPEMKGFSPRNLKYMRAFAEAWPEEAFVQAPRNRIWHKISRIRKFFRRATILPRKV
jgi:uncharacterized protein YecE (DUF72 family)